MIRGAEDLRAVLGVAFTDEQIAAITAPAHPVAIVAGAGSGKTTVMAARVVWLVGTGQVEPDGVLGLTFTDKAAGELGQRIRLALARATGSTERDVEPTVATYHSYAGTLIGEHGLRIGVEPHARLLADATRYQLAARVIRAAPGPFRVLAKPVGMLVEDVLALDAELSEHLVSVEALRAHDRALPDRVAAAGPGRPSAGARAAVDTAAKRLELCELVAAYRHAKHERDLVDFGDQMSLAAHLAETCPPVGAAERARYRVVLLDEYQDTSVAQRRMLVGLFAGGHPVTAVGDPCQAIYGWRGASVANLDDFPVHFPTRSARPAARLALAENRRSDTRVVSLANRLAAPLRDRHPGLAELRAAPGAGPGEIRVAVHPTQAQELSWVADQVQAAIAEGTPAREVAVLVRVTRDIGALHGQLSARDVPVEVVGLGGLVHLPEVADLVAVLEVLDDPTANAALVRVLTGPRWRIGARDLALLGRRAAELAHPPAPPDSEAPQAGTTAVGAPDPNGASTPDPLAEAVAGQDLDERIALCDALGAPGPGGYSETARRRFAALDVELRELRRHLGEPVLDLLHRIAAATGLDVEVAASPHALAARRRETLAAFTDVAATFTDLDGDTSVAAFLAYLRAAADHERGLDSAVPGEGDSVKLLTAHKAKGLEWDVVILPDVTAEVFPSQRGRPRWTRRAESLPYDLRGDRGCLPEVMSWSAKGLARFDEAVRDLAAAEELRLAYVACTRARRRLVASAHWWGTTQKRARGPSPYLTRMIEYCESEGMPVGPLAPAPPEGSTNPLLGAGREFTWPAPPDPAVQRARAEAAALVTEALRGAAPPAGELGPDEASTVAAWDRDIGLVLDELRRDTPAETAVELPGSLSASQLLTFAQDPGELARTLARPMPRRPSPQARLGTRFHSWVESSFAQAPLLDPEEIPGAADGAEGGDDAEFAALKEAFRRGPYAHRRPHGVEVPFRLVLAGRVITGRIDAVYEHLDGFEVVDWKTNRHAPADPLQLGVYRLAWAEIAGVDIERVTAAFLYVRSGRVVRPALADRRALEDLLGGSGG